MFLEIILFFTLTCWFIGKKIASKLPDEEPYNSPSFSDNKPTVINNYTTNIQNNLNITDEQLKKLKS